jgi:hypothetical protein
MGWPEVAGLWEMIKNQDTPEWDSGKALEHLVVRAFALSQLDVDYPYDVPPGGDVIEQIDGIVYWDGLAFLLECKDRDKVDVEAIAKLRNQLLRRPDTAMGCVFVSREFTEPALILADFAVPHRILLWQGTDIENAIAARDFKSALREKYRHLCKYGLTDHSPNYPKFKV